MKVVAVGCGGIGGVIAGRLAAAGVEVTPVTHNPAVADALNREGFRIDGVDGPAVIPLRVPAVATVPADGGPYDWAFMMTQATSLPAAFAAMLPRLKPGGIVVCFQNGIPEEPVVHALGPDRVLGCVVGWGSSMVSPGVYNKTSAGGFQLGTVDGRDRPIAHEVARMLDAVAPCAVTQNLPGVRWSKLGINAAITTLGAVSGMRLGQLMVHREARRAALEVFTEVVRVAQARGVRMEKVGGTLDLAQIALTAAEKSARLGGPSLLKKHTVLLAVGMKYRRLRSSMLYALERGRDPEVDHLNGQVVRAGDAAGVPTPVNRRLTEMVHEIAAGRRKSSLANIREATAS